MPLKPRLRPVHRTMHSPSARAAALALLAAAPWVQAETSPYYVGVAQTFQHSSNLLRLADEDGTPAGYSRSDSVSSTALLAGLDQTIGRQRVFGNATLRSNRYSRNDSFNNNGFALEAGLDWATVERLSGSLRATANRNLARFNTDEFGLLTKKNVENTRSVDAMARVGVATALTLEGGYRHTGVDYSATEYRSRNLAQHQWTAGLKFRPSAATSLGLALRSGSGEYPDYSTQTDGSSLADEFKRRDVDLSLAYTPSDLSTLDLRVSRSQIDHERASDRSYATTTGLLRWRWQATGKLRLSTELARDTGLDNYFLQGSSQTQSVDYSRISTALRLRADQAITAKLAANLQYAHTRRSLSNTAPQFTGLGSVEGADRSQRWALGLNWTPLRALTLGCDVSREVRTSDNVLSRGYADQSGSCFAQFVLQ